MPPPTTAPDRATDGHADRRAAERAGAGADGLGAAFLVLGRRRAVGVDGVAIAIEGHALVDDGAVAGDDRVDVGQDGVDAATLVEQVVVVFVRGERVVSCATWCLLDLAVACRSGSGGPAQSGRSAEP